MTRGDLAGLTVFGRPLKPVAFGLTLTMIVVTAVNVQGMDRGTIPPLSHLVAALAAVSVLALAYGWAFGHQKAAEIGLLLVIGTYATRATFIAFASGLTEPAVWFSLSTVVIAAGSYALEVNDRYRGSHENGGAIRG